MNEMPLPLYDSRPPVWVPRTHSSADIGYIGFHPPRPGQDEDVLTTDNIRKGFSPPQVVPAERFSAQEEVSALIRSKDALHNLEKLVQDVFARRTDNVALIPTSTFRMPTRVTLNDSKRQAWFADLANPEVPLAKLGKSVPHGAKGHDLLDLLHSNQVAIPRAVWFLRVLGANETAGLRNKPSYNPTQYSVDWANVVTNYLKKQLADIALPSAPRLGLNIKQTFKGVLADTDTRERWISRFSYSLELLRPCYSEGLVDSRTFLVWLVQQMGSSTLAQVGFLVRLAEEYVDGIMKNRSLARPFIDACLSKLAEISSTPTQEFMMSTQTVLRVLLQRVCLALPDAFVSPRMWSTHAALVSEALNESLAHDSMEAHIAQNSQDIQQLLLDSFSDIKRRNEAMLFTNLPAHVSAKLRTVVSDVQSLNSISSKTDLGSVAFFSTQFDDISVFKDKLQMLLTWTVTPLQFGDHRPAAAVTLIQNWRDKIGERATRRDFCSPDEFLQEQLFEWLDTSEIAEDSHNLRAVSILYGKLVKAELFSYAGYIQHLIARGEEGLHFSDTSTSRHRDFLRSIPLWNTTAALTTQRKVTLHGIRARETVEDLHEREIRGEIRALLPQLSSHELNGTIDKPSPDVASKCPSLTSASRFEQVRIFRHWLMPVLRKYFSHPNQEQVESTPQLVNCFAVCTELMVHTKCFHSVLELSLCALQRSTTVELLTAVIDTLYRFGCIWNCMNVMGTIANALFAAHKRWKKTRGGEFRALLNALVDFDGGRFLDEISRAQVDADITSFTLALQPQPNLPEPTIPDVLPEILLLLEDPRDEAPSNLASGLWIRYRVSPDWALKVWDNVVAGVRQIPYMHTEPDGQRARAVRYGVFLWHINEHLPRGLDDQVLKWFLGSGKNEVGGLGADAWTVLTTVLLHLAINGALQATTILEGLIYPTWQLGATVSSSQEGQSRQVLLHAINSLFEQLLFQHDVGNETMTLLESQRMQTRRQAVYEDPHFSLLITTIPLLVSLESNGYLSQDIRAAFTSLRLTLSSHHNFRQAAFGNLDAIRETFNQSLAEDELDDNRAKVMVAALRELLSESSEDAAIELSTWPDVTSLLSPWKLTATAIELQFLLRHMGRALSCEGAHTAAAQVSLDKLILMIFHHSMTSEQAYFVAQMARGTEGVVAAKFINNGLKRVTEILHGVDMTSSKSLGDGFERTEELLRVIAYVAEPLRTSGSLLPSLDSVIQDEFFSILSEKFVQVDQALKEHPSDDILQEKLTHTAISLSRLLQFHLGFPFSWTARIKESSSSLLSTILGLVIMHGSGTMLDLGAYSLLIDTLYYLLDELVHNSRTSATFDPFAHAPHVLPSDIPADFPREYRNQVQALLRHLPPPALVSQLATSLRDSSGGFTHSPVHNRPWEWIENLGEPNPVGDDKPQSVRNSGSVSLELFAARLTGDVILQHADGDTRHMNNMRSFQDGLSTESVLKRDWSETRMEPDAASLVDGGLGGIGARLRGGDIPFDRRRASPASSAISRASTHGSHGSRASPGPSRLTNISEDSGDSSFNQGTKRKATDDEEVAVKKAKPAPKPRGKRK
ncbi:Med12 domain-containing protein [Mycena indigotica]|uniref:Mediator of RNA polymerase II transcription subunit 12 n=1 Tax=Mycena indigotica TaxID=2126181 RepID=A0A8H6SLT2_9AGAR|nr:Med12 domain-containing protein [Mycena indigotica]KAF7301177.1 Med12 domain-containing protein [Mycena indigotica]